MDAFLEMAKRPEERRTHTEAILPFFSSGVSGFDPQLARDWQSVTYGELFDLNDEIPVPGRRALSPPSSRVPPARTPPVSPRQVATSPGGAASPQASPR